MPRSLIRPVRQILVIFILSVTIVSTGIYILFNGTGQWWGILLIIIGITGGPYLLFYLYKNDKRVISAGNGNSFSQIYLNQNNGPRIVTIGGGTGLGTILRGLKKITPNLTAIVTVADDGGSSGRLRQEFGILPPGDIRSCLIAMANLEPLMEQLMQYRFNGGSGLSGHNFGNLFLTAMTGITGDFEKAIEASSQVLAVRGRVFPATPENVTLRAELSDGTVINGETAIGYSNSPIRRVFLEPPAVRAVPEAIKAILEADVVILGPGSLYTSIIPPLLVREIADAVRRTGAIRIYICNVMTQPGETEGYTASDHLQALIDNTGNFVDYVILNTQEVPEKIRKLYAEEGSEPVVPDIQNIARLGPAPIAEPLLQINCVARHNADRLAEVIMGLIRSAKQGVRFRNSEDNPSTDKEDSVNYFNNQGKFNRFTAWERIKKFVGSGFFIVSMIITGVSGYNRDGWSKESGFKLPYTTVSIQGEHNPGYKIYSDRREKKEIEEHLPEGLKTDKYVIVGLYLGERPSCGYEIIPEAVYLEDADLIIKYREKTPPPGELTAQVMTYPGLLIALEKSNLPENYRVILKKRVPE